MAASRGKKKDPVARAFVAAVMVKLKVEGPRQLAHKLGMYTADEERKVGRWVSGENAPNFHTTMWLLEICGWLKREGLEAYGHSTRPPATAAESEEALRRAETEAPRPNERAGRRRG